MKKSKNLDKFLYGSWIALFDCQIALFPNPYGIRIGRNLLLGNSQDNQKSHIWVAPACPKIVLVNAEFPAEIS